MINFISNFNKILKAAKKLGMHVNYHTKEEDGVDGNVLIVDLILSNDKGDLNEVIIPIVNKIVKMKNLKKLYELTASEYVTEYVVLNAVFGSNNGNIYMIHVNEDGKPDFSIGFCMYEDFVKHSFQMAFRFVDEVFVEEFEKMIRKVI